MKSDAESSILRKGVRHESEIDFSVTAQVRVAGSYIVKVMNLALLCSTYVLTY